MNNNKKKKNKNYLNEFSLYNSNFIAKYIKLKIINNKRIFIPIIAIQ